MKATRQCVANMVSQVHFKGGNTLKNLLMFPKDKQAITKQSNSIYWFKCGRTECNDEYIGESARTFEDRYKEHLKAPSPIFEHQNITGHTTTVENFKIIEREGQNMTKIGVQTSFHHGKQYSFFWSVEKCYTYQN